MTMGDQPSFIAQARREQIIKATVETLNEIGYVNVSLAKIAKKAKISAGLISYHFQDKDDLINHTLVYLLKKQYEYIEEKVRTQQSAYDQLIAFVGASIDYQAAHNEHNIALIEIIFNVRTEENVPFYKVTNVDEDPLYALLQNILVYGQKTQEFSEFNPKYAAIMIQGAIAESMLINGESFDSEVYKQVCIEMITRMIKRNGT